uniref:LRRCT domain-containing protein n=1 Tax=Strigamia maritima TaxID=126957 RepID=T1JC41_STRMM
MQLLQLSNLYIRQVGTKKPKKMNLDNFSQSRSEMSNIHWILSFYTLITCVSSERHTQMCESPEPQFFSCHINSTFHSLSRVPFDALYMVVTIEEKFHTLEEKPFEKFMLLQVLNIASSGLQILSNSAFDGLSNLATLTVRGRVSVIENNSFKPCHSLRRLDLANNEIFQIFYLAIALEHLVNLETLILTHNPLESISIYALSPLSQSSIVNLDLTDCQLSYIGHAALSNLTHLIRLSMSHNPITQSNLENALNNISTNLKVLRLAHLNLTYLPLEAMRWISDLEELSLTHHEIKLIDSGDASVPLMAHLHKLNLSYGALSTIDESVFVNWPSLQTLDLSYNNLLHIPFDSIGHHGPIVLDNLTYLDLSHNQIVVKPDPVNFSLIAPNLIFLQLSYNNITYNPIQYEKLKKLETLHLNHNLVIPWHRSLISDSDFSLMALYVDNNQLTSVTPAMLSDFGVLRYLSLHNNPFACITCQVYELAKWMNKTSTHLIDTNNIKCIKPKRELVMLMTEPFYCNITKM